MNVENVDHENLKKYLVDEELAVLLLVLLVDPGVLALRAVAEDVGEGIVIRPEALRATDQRRHALSWS